MFMIYSSAIDQTKHKQCSQISLFFLFLCIVHVFHSIVSELHVRFPVTYINFLFFWQSHLELIFTMYQSKVDVAFLLS